MAKIPICHLYRLTEHENNADRHSIAINIYLRGSVVAPDRRLSFMLKKLTLTTLQELLYGYNTTSDINFNMYIFQW